MPIAELKTKIENLTAEITAAQTAYAENKDPEAATTLLDLQNQKAEALNELATELESNADPLSKDIEERLAQVRKEEKDKLYSSMSSLKTEKERLEAAMKEQEAKLKAAEEAVQGLKGAQQHQEPTDPKSVSADKVNEMLEAALERHQAIAEQQIAAAKQEAQEKVAALEAQLLKAELEAHRGNLLKQYGDKIIPEMVSGNTIEELNNSALVARQAYERIFKQAGAASAEAVNQVRESVPSAPSAKLSSVGGEVELTAEQIKKLSPAEWKEYRSKLGFK